MSSTDARPTLRAVLARPGFRRLWAARTVSQWGDVIQFTTLALLVLRLTGSGLGVSGAVIAEIAPVLLLAPLAGPLVDRLPRVQVMVAADVVRVCLAGALAVWHSNVVVVYVLAFGLSAGSVFFNPAAGSLLPTLVDDEQLVAANSGIWSAAVLSQVALAPVAGILVATVGFAPAFALNSASFALSAALLQGLRAGERPSSIATEPLWVEGRAAIAFLARDGLFRALAVAQALAALSAGATSALLVVLARRHLHTSGTGFGLMLAGIALGAFGGPLLLTRLGTRARRPAIVFAAFGLRGVVDFVLATVQSLTASLGALFAYGVGTSTGTVTFNSVVQSHADERMRGRVFAAYDLIWQAMRLVSILAGGVLADALGIRAVYYAGGALLVTAALAGTTASRPRAAPSDS